MSWCGGASPLTQFPALRALQGSAGGCACPLARPLRQLQQSPALTVPPGTVTAVDTIAVVLEGRGNIAQCLMSHVTVTICC